MALFEELDEMFPSHSHFYVVNLSTMNEALDKCARVCVGIPQLINYSGQMILVSQSGLSNDISWLTEIPAPAQLEAPPE